MVEGRSGFGLSVTRYSESSCVGCWCCLILTIIPSIRAIVESWPSLVENSGHMSNDIQFLTGKTSNPNGKSNPNWKRFGDMAGNVTYSRPCSVGGRSRTGFWSLVQQRLQWIYQLHSLQGWGGISLLVLLSYYRLRAKNFAHGFLVVCALFCFACSIRHLRNGTHTETSSYGLLRRSLLKLPGKSQLSPLWKTNFTFSYIE